LFPQSVERFSALEISMIARKTTLRFVFVLSLAILFGVVGPSPAQAQGFISPSFGYNFGGDAGCLEAFDCEDKNWNFALSGGALGSIVGFEVEWLYASNFFGETDLQSTTVTTFMGNFMLAPKISIVQLYGLAGIGLMRTDFEDAFDDDESENQIGWDVGGGVMVFVHPNVAIKGDIRYYHSFEALDLLGFDFGQDENRLDFGRAAFGVVFKF
jgi:opacity protein-like surface antigen